jgi:hypothetical protein
MPQQENIAQEAQIDPRFPTMMQGWTDFARDVIDGSLPELDAMLQFTYFHGAQDIMRRVAKINREAVAAKNPQLALDEINRLVRELNAAINILASTPENFSGQAEKSKRPGLILPPGAGKLAN